jgi:type I restriction enzyme S subunit
MIEKFIGEVCKVIAGQSPESKFYNQAEEGLPFYQGKKEFKEKYIGKPTTWTTKTTKEAFKDDILMSVRAPVGPVNFSTEHICIGRGLAAIRAKENLNKEYLFYFLIYHENEIIGNKGAVFNSINKNQIENLKIPLPENIEQQKQIVEVLDKSFEAIDKAKANIEKNIQNTKELFQSRLNEIFSQKGDGWEEKTINDVCEKIFAGGDVPKDNFSKEETDKYNIPIFANAVKERGLYGFTDFAKVTEPSITISARGSGTGHTELRKVSFFPIVRLIVLIPNLELMNLEFLKYLIDNLEIVRSGSAIPQLTVPMIKEYSVFFPTIIKQKQIVLELDKLKEQTKQLEIKYKQKLKNLEELKKSILEKAFSGELLK